MRHLIEADGYLSKTYLQKSILLLPLHNGFIAFTEIHNTCDNIEKFYAMQVSLQRYVVLSEMGGGWEREREREGEREGGKCKFSFDGARRLL